MNRMIINLLASSALAACITTMAGAQTTSDNTAGSKSPDISDIVVTGTLLRGIAPVGNNVIGFNQLQIEETGARSTNELLAKIPQVGYFGTIPFGPSGIVGSNGSNPIARPNLRNLPAAQTSGGAQTLVLIDGHRVVGAGTQQVGVDPDIIAPSAIKKVEALTDGGSAVYGSDALGGVINFITIKRFNGVEANLRLSTGNDITSYDGYVTAGKDWGNGGLYVSYNYAHHDAIYGSDRDFIKRIDWNTGIPVGRFCAAPNIAAAGKNFVVSGAGLASAASPNVCDQSDNTTVFPDSTQQNVYARLNQELNDSITFDLTGLWAHRETEMNGGTLGSDNYRSAITSTVTYVPLGVIPGRGQVASALYRPIPGDPTGKLPEAIKFNYEPVFGPRSNTQDTILDTYQIVPTFTVKLGHDWELRALGSYGYSKVSYNNHVLNSTVQPSLLASGAINPFDVAASTPAALAAVVGYDRGYGRNQLYNLRAIVDGPLVHLPGGELRVALGAEYLQDDFDRQSSTTALILTKVSSYQQSVKSLFGEAVIPIFSNENGFDGMRSLTASVSARYDKYNDFGDTFNPKLGLAWQPVDWFTLKGSWGKSFNAPSPVDQLGVVTATATNPAPASAFLVPPPPGVTFAPNEAGILLANGAVANLQPQTATSWSITTTFTPTVTPGLSVNLSYYTINLEGTLGRPVGVDLTPYWTQFPDLYLIRPTGIDLSNFLADIPAGNRNFVVCNPTAATLALISSSNSTCATASPVGAAIDTLVRNLGKTKLTGIDFAISYTHPMSFGSIDAGFAGNRRLTQDTQVSPLAPVIAELDTNNPKMRFQATLGANVGGLRAQGAWNHVSGYARAGGYVPANFDQGYIDKFDTFDLYLKYDVNGTGAAKDLSFTLNIQNLFDANPPLVKNSDSTSPGFDPSLAFTLGRYFQFSIGKKF